MKLPRYFQLIDETTADMVAFFERRDDLDQMLIADLNEHGPDSVRGLILLVGDESGPDVMIQGDDLVSYAKALTTVTSR